MLFRSDVLKVSKQLYFSSLTQGSKISDFEHRIANYVGAKYAVVVASATAGLHLSLLSLNLPVKSEVITSPISFVASSNAIFYNQLVPKFIDVENEYLSISNNLVLNEIESNPNISAIVPVHFAGYAQDLGRMREKTAGKNKIGRAHV